MTEESAKDRYEDDVQESAICFDKNRRAPDTASTPVRNGGTKLKSVAAPVGMLSALLTRTMAFTGDATALGLRDVSCCKKSVPWPPFRQETFKDVRPKKIISEAEKE
jgi:hypothetical protein